MWDMDKVSKVKIRGLRFVGGWWRKVLMSGVFQYGLTMKLGG